MMNKDLKEFLESLSDDQANDLWSWLDDHCYAASEMIKVIVDSHPKLTEGILG